MKRTFAICLACLGTGALASEANPGLPPDEIVARVLATNPGVQAAGSQIQVEEANRRRLEAGPYEWSVRLGGQQRLSTQNGPNEQRFNEWNAAIERPLRLPGKSSADAELGAAGVELAEIARGEARHEISRTLLKAWFTWLRESASTAQWAEQIALLEKQAKAVERRQQLGDAARLETIQAEAALAQAAAQQAQAQARQRTAAEDIARRFPGLPLVAPATLAEPVPVTGSVDEWIAAIREHSHELGVARGESRRSQLFAGRSGSDRIPDPTVGMHVARERDGEDRILGAYITIPLSGGARRATTDAALAEADAAGRREAAALQKVTAEAAALYYAASAAHASWLSGQGAAERLVRAADMTARGYQLGEGSLNDLLAARRMANEAQLSARLLRLDALELRYRLLLDAHRLWDMDETPHDGK